MLRKDKALLESLTRKYGKDNLVKEVNSKYDTYSKELLHYLIDDKDLNMPIFAFIQTKNFDPASIFLLKTNNMDSLNEYGLDGEPEWIEEIWNLKVGEVWEDPNTISGGAALVVRIA